MPRNDGTGPQGNGPNTGRNMGPCNTGPSDTEKEKEVRLGNGRDQGRGQGRGQCRRQNLRQNFRQNG